MIECRRRFFPGALFIRFIYPNWHAPSAASGYCEIALVPKIFAMAQLRSGQPRLSATSSSGVLPALFCLLLICWTSDIFAAERIQNPKVGVLYVYNARLAAVDIRARTFTVCGIVDNRERLTLSVKPSTKLLRGGGVVTLANGRIGEVISGALMIHADRKVVAVTTTFGSPLPSKAPLATKLVEVNGLASAGHVRNPTRGNVTTSVIAMPTTR
jgi:hypothetical protein